MFRCRRRRQIYIIGVVLSFLFILLVLPSKKPTPESLNTHESLEKEKHQVHLPTPLLKRDIRPVKQSSLQLIERNLTLRGYSYERLLPPHKQHTTPSDTQLKHVFEQRKLQLHAACQKLNLTNRETPLWSNLYVHEPTQFVFCPIPKIASTNWKMVFAELYGLVRPDNPVLDSADRFWMLWTRTVFNQVKKLEQYDEKQREKIMKEYRFAMVARHPIERIVSAHRDKFKIHFYEKEFGRNIVRKYRKNATPEELASGKDVTFEEFVAYLSDSWEAKETFEYHWQRQYELCTPCSVPFTYIAHFESANSDCEFILRELGVDEKRVRFRSSSVNSNTGTPSDELVSQRLKLLTEQQQRKLYDIYRYDLDLLGY